jgi:type II secretory pathway component GspD/PulD (secretin)
MITFPTTLRPARRAGWLPLIPALAFCLPLLPAQPDLAPDVEGRGAGAFIPMTEPSGAVAAVAPSASVAPANDGIRLNFQGAALSDVLTYLSEAAGFVILVDQEVSGTVNVISHQPLSMDEAVDLLNAILIEKGYVALRSGRILRIVPRADAHKRDLPVRTASRPADIPRTDAMVTQIIPVRFGDALKMIENLRPLLANDATLSANESSNAIVMTDTQTNIRRMAEIIDALDTSIASISTIRVFPLEFADASQLATVVRELFASDALSRIAGGGNIPRAVLERFRMGGGRGGEGASSSDSEARQAASRVVAVSDERSNSLIVSAPDDLIPTIEELVAKVDTNIADITEVRIFRLENSDANELASLIATLYTDDTTTQTTGRAGQQGFRPGQQRAAAGTDAQRSQRALLQARVVVVGDPRTNSLLVNAGRETMMQIAELVGRLDSGTDRKQRVYVHPLDHADVENVAGILRGMFENQTTGARGTTRNQQTTTGRLTERAATGATSDTGTSATFGGGRATR